MVIPRAHRVVTADTLNTRGESISNKRKRTKISSPLPGTSKVDQCDCSFDIGSPEEIAARSKTWTQTSMPDKDGNVTLTTMATWKCPCGKVKRGKIGQTKGDVTIVPKRELILAKLITDDRIVLSEMADELNVSTDNLKKVIGKFLIQGVIDGTLEGDIYYANNSEINL